MYKAVNIHCSNYQVTMCEDSQENIHQLAEGPSDTSHSYFYLRVSSDEKCWTIRRTYENFRLFDKQLHRCIYDRRYSQLPELKKNEPQDEGTPVSNQVELSQWQTRDCRQVLTDTLLM